MGSGCRATGVAKRVTCHCQGLAGGQSVPGAQVACFSNCLLQACLAKHAVLCRIASGDSMVGSPDEPYDHVLILSIVSGRLSSKLRLRISKPFSSGYGRQCLPRHVRCLRCRVYRISRRLKLPWSGMAEGWLSSSGIWKLSISIQS